MLGVRFNPNPPHNLRTLLKIIERLRQWSCLCQLLLLALLSSVALACVADVMRWLRVAECGSRLFGRIKSAFTVARDWYDLIDNERHWMRSALACYRVAYHAEFVIDWLAAWS